MTENTSHTLLPNAFALFNGIQTSSPGPDRGESVLHLGPNSLNPYGLLHGGAYYTMADCAGGRACRTDGRYYVTLHGGIDFVHSASAGKVRRERRKAAKTPRVSVRIIIPYGGASVFLKNAQKKP